MHTHAEPLSRRFKSRATLLGFCLMLMRSLMAAQARASSSDGMTGDHLLKPREARMAQEEGWSGAGGAQSRRQFPAATSPSSLLFAASHWLQPRTLASDAVGGARGARSFTASSSVQTCVAVERPVEQGASERPRGKRRRRPGPAALDLRRRRRSHPRSWTELLMREEERA